MSTPVAVPIPRCCPAHHDWATLAEHLLDDFTGVPASAIIGELWRARQAGELCCLELPDAIDCAELIVRQRVSSATGRMPFQSATPRPPATVVVQVAQSAAAGETHLPPPTALTSHGAARRQGTSTAQ